jgi:hydrogenase maturation protease
MGVKKMSLHQTGFQEVLAAAELTAQAPEDLALIGVQPEELENFGGPITPTVQAQIPAAIELALQWLKRWGVEPML